MISGHRGLKRSKLESKEGREMKMLSRIGLVALALGLASCLFQLKYTVGGTVSGLRGSGLVLQNNSGDSLTVLANGNFVFPKSITKASDYSVSVATQPTNPVQTCSIRNGSGTITSDVTNVLVSCIQQAQFAYVANKTDNTISAFLIDGTTGALTPIAGSPFANTGTSPDSLLVDPSGQYLYVANNGSADVSVYSINVTSGALVSAGLPLAAGDGPAALAIDPGNRYLFVANQLGNSVSVFAIPSTGLATAVSGSPFAVGAGPFSVVTDPNGNFLYVANFSDNSVTAMAISPTSGTLTSIAGSPFGTGAGPVSIAINPAGTFAYVANETSASVSVFGVDASDGVLTTVAGSPFATGTSPESLAVDPQGRYLYAANVTSVNEITDYAINPTLGTITAGSPIASDADPLSIVIDPLGGFAFAANSTSGDVSVYTIDATTGVLVPVTGSPFAAGAGARSIALY